MRYMKVHLKKRHPKLKFTKCESCEMLQFEDLLNQHRPYCKLDIISSGQVVCDQCGIEVSKATLAMHLETHELRLNETYVCDLCGERITTKRALRHHMRYYHIITDFTCRVCKLEFPSQLSMFRHKKAKHTNEPRPCQFCDFQAMSDVELRQHKVLKHVEATKDYKCLECGMKFYQKAHLYQHKTLHTDHVSMTKSLLLNC